MWAPGTELCQAWHLEPSLQPSSVFCYYLTYTFMISFVLLCFRTNALLEHKLGILTSFLWLTHSLNLHNSLEVGLSSTLQVLLFVVFLAVQFYRQSLCFTLSIYSHFHCYILSSSTRPCTSIITVTQ